MPEFNDTDKYRTEHESCGSFPFWFTDDWQKAELPAFEDEIEFESIF